MQLCLVRRRWHYQMFPSNENVNVLFRILCVYYYYYHRVIFNRLLHLTNNIGRNKSSFLLAMAFVASRILQSAHEAAWRKFNPLIFIHAQVDQDGKVKVINFVFSYVIGFQRMH